MKVDKFNESSRSEVASSHKEELSEMYAVSLTHLMENLNITHALSLTRRDLDICKLALDSTKKCISEKSSFDLHKMWW